MTYNGQAVTGQTFFYPNGGTTYAQTHYWKVANSGVTIVARVDYNGTVTPSSTFFPQNMTPGQAVAGDTAYTFVGFETVNLASKTFSNACHFKDSGGDVWYAPGYGNIKEVGSDGSTTRYNGDI